LLYSLGGLNSDTSKHAQCVAHAADLNQAYITEAFNSLNTSSDICSHEIKLLAVL